MSHGAYRGEWEPTPWWAFWRPAWRRPLFFYDFGLMDHDWEYRDEPPCPHGDNWDDCPVCRH